MILVGVDAHKASHTAVALDGATHRVLAERTVPADRRGCAELVGWVRTLGPQVGGVGLEDVRPYTRTLEQVLVGAGFVVVRVPPGATPAGRRGARTRGKSDPIDAAAVAACVPRYSERRVRAPDPAAEELALVVGHHADLVAERTRTVNRLRALVHRHAPEARLPRTLRTPRAALRAQQALRGALAGAAAEIAAELCGDLVRLCERIGALERRIGAAVAERAPQLLAIPGCGPISAGRLLVRCDGVTRFCSPAKLARYAGIAPVPAHSGATHRHRLDRTGDRQLNLAIHQIALTQARCHGPARTYLAKKRAEGKRWAEAMRCLKRQLVNVVYRALVRAERARVGAVT